MSQYNGNGFCSGKNTSGFTQCSCFSKFQLSPFSWLYSQPSCTISWYMTPTTRFSFCCSYEQNEIQYLPVFRWWYVQKASGNEYLSNNSVLSWTLHNWVGQKVLNESCFEFLVSKPLLLIMKGKRVSFYFGFFPLVKWIGDCNGNSAPLANQSHKLAQFSGPLSPE